VVIDSSALVAILLREPDAELSVRALADAPVRLISAVSGVELAFVIAGRKGEAGRAVTLRLRLLLPCCHKYIKLIG
jgi:ribonuclease VapC